MAVALQRTVFESSRAAEYFTLAELEAQTGQPAERFAAVVLKELVDNGLDAAEAERRAPEVRISLLRRGGLLRLVVRDNGGGIPPDTVRRILNFKTRTSDK